MSLNDLPTEIILYLNQYLTDSSTCALLRTQKRLATLLTPTLYDQHIRYHARPPDFYGKAFKRTSNKTSPITCFDFANRWTSPTILCYLRALPPSTFEAPTNGRCTLLHHFAAHGNATLLSIFIEKGVDIDAKGDTSVTPLMKAVQRRNESMGIALLNAGADPRAVDIHPENSILSSAITNNSLPLIKRLTLALQERGGDVFSPSTSGHILRRAVSTGNADIVGIILDLGADMHELNTAYIFTTHLISAVTNGFAGIVELLLDRGADVLQRGRYGETALSEVARTGRDLGIMRRVVEAVIAAGGDVSARGVERWFTPLHHFAHRGHVEGVEMMLEYGADVGALARGGVTALHSALVRFGQERPKKEEVCRVLIKAMREKSVSVSVPTTGRMRMSSTVKLYGGMSALHVAAALGALDMVTLLIDAGADMNGVDVRGRTPLVAAICYRRIEVCVFLAKKMREMGCDFSITINERFVDFEQRHSSYPRYETLLELAESRNLDILATLFADAIDEKNGWKDI